MTAEEMIEIADKLEALALEERDLGRLSWETMKLGYGANELRRIAKQRLEDPEAELGPHPFPLNPGD